MNQVTCENALAFADCILALRSKFKAEERFILEHVPKLSMGQFKAFIQIARLGKCTMGDLAKEMPALSLSSVTIVVDKLVKADFVTRDRCQRDRRVVYVKLSEKGEQLYNAYQEMFKDACKQMLSYLTEAEQQELLRLYQLITQDVVND